MNNTNNIKVSIIIPVYNVEQYIRECLDSVINQTLKDIEIICIDDKSTDNSLQILKEYKEKDDRIVLIEQAINQGQGVARNIGIENAKGEYIMFLDSDDWYELNACEELYNHIKKYDNEMVIFDVKEYSNITKQYLEITSISKFKNLFVSNNIDLNNLDKPFMPPNWASNKIYKKSFIINNDILFSSTRCGEDIIFVIKSYIYSKNCSYYDKVLYYYRIDNSDSSSNQLKRYSETINNKKNVYNFLHKYKVSRKKIYISYLIQYINSLFYWYNILSKYNNEIKFHYYNQMKDIYIKLNNKEDISLIKDYINYDNFMNIINKSYDEYIKYYDSIYQIKLFSCIPILSMKRKENNIKINLFNIIPLLKIKYKQNKSKYYFLGLPIWKVKTKNNKKKYYLFNFLPILIIKRK